MSEAPRARANSLLYATAQSKKGYTGCSLSYIYIPFGSIRSRGGGGGSKTYDPLMNSIAINSIKTCASRVSCTFFFFHFFICLYIICIIIFFMFQVKKNKHIADVYTYFLIFGEFFFFC